MAGGPLWEAMHARTRRPAPAVQGDEVPRDPGVYAWYRDGDAIYLGKASSLRKRVWGKHLSKGRGMTDSAFRRNVAQHLGIATAKGIYTGAYDPTDDDLAGVRAFIEGCHIAWVPTESRRAAEDLEREMKREWKPPLTRI